MVGCLILCIFLKRFLVDIFTPIERHPAGFESDMAKMQAYNFCILSRFALQMFQLRMISINSRNLYLHITQPILTFWLELEPFDSQTSATTTRSAQKYLQKPQPGQLLVSKLYTCRSPYTECNYEISTFCRSPWKENWSRYIGGWLRSTINQKLWVPTDSDSTSGPGSRSNSSQVIMRWLPSKSSLSLWLRVSDSPYRVRVSDSA